MSHWLLLRKKCPHSELFWSAFFGIRTEYGGILCISPYSVRVRENSDQNNSEYGHFLRRVLDIFCQKDMLKLQYTFMGFPLVLKIKFFIKYFLIKCDQIRRKLPIWSHLLKKVLMENLLFRAVPVYLPLTLLKLQVLQKGAT